MKQSIRATAFEARVISPSMKKMELRLLVRLGLMMVGTVIVVAALVKLL